jgi:predicted nucleotidyltransferase
VLRAALAPLADRIELALVYGSVAGGRQRRESDVDVLVVGDVSFGQIVSALGPAQQQTGREINPSVYPSAEFRAKMAAGQHFLSTVLKGDVFYLIGDERELARLAGKRVAR